MSILKGVWRVLVAVGLGLLALLGIRAWKDRQERQRGRDDAEQEALRQRREQMKADLEFLRARQAGRLEREVAREEAETRLRAEADAKIVAPAPAEHEDVIEAARKAVEDREQ